jgi:hypothetical protein
VSIYDGALATVFAEPRELPSGFKRLTAIRLVTLPDIELATVFTNTRSPEVPLKVSVPFWPGVDIVNATAEPPAVIVFDASAGTDHTFAVTVPEPTTGETFTVYVPVDDRLVVSMNPGFPETNQPVDAMLVELGFNKSA